MNNLHPLHLHEIRILIAKQLNTRSLHACTLVNHDWNASFTPHLYHSVHITYRGPYITDTTNSSIQHIRHITISYDLPPWPGSLGVSHLASLTVLPPPRSILDPETWAFLAKLVSSATDTLSLVDLCTDRGTPAFWHALARCQALKTLRMSHTSVNNIEVPLVHKVCAMVETLDFQNVTIAVAMSQPPYSAPLMRLRHLRMRGIPWGWTGWLSNDADEADDRAMIVPWTCSPNLESMVVVDKLNKASGRLRLFRLEVVTADIRAALAANEAGRNFYSIPHSKNEVHGGDKLCEQYRGLIPARRLHTLETVSETMQDQDIAFLLDHVETMQVLCVPTSQAGLLTTSALARHYTTLTKINVRHTNLGSLDVLTIMQNCSHLHSLGATGLLGQDIVASSVKPWACTKLKRLSVDILIDWVDLSSYTAQLQGVFQKLGELTQLEFLDLLSKEPLAEGLMWPRLKCEYGIGYLAGMTKLREIYAQWESYDGVDRQDAAWMTNHWPELEAVGASGHLDGINEQGAMTFLRARGIKTSAISKASLEI